MARWCRISWTPYRFTAPDPPAKADFPITAHAAAWQTLAAVAGRAIDGGALLLHLSQPGALASDGLGLGRSREAADRRSRRRVPGVGRAPVLPAVDTVRDMEPASPRVRAGGVGTEPRPAGRTLRARVPRRPTRLVQLRRGRSRCRVHTGGTQAAATGDQLHADDRRSSTACRTRATGPSKKARRTSATSSPDTTDIAKLLLIEFGLVFANDWFLLPIELPVGSLTAIRGLAVTNVFGERFWIEPAVTAPATEFRAGACSGSRRKGCDRRPAVRACDDTGRTGELRRSKRSPACATRCRNMVWGIETIVQLADGSSRRGREVALELHAKHQAAVVAPPATTPENDAKIKYTLMTSVAEHWIPFIPVHIEGDNRQIQLQRAAMPRLLEGEVGVTPAKIAPRTRLLREGSITCLRPVLPRRGRGRACGHGRGNALAALPLETGTRRDLAGPPSHNRPRRSVEQPRLRHPRAKAASFATPLAKK